VVTEEIKLSQELHVVCKYFSCTLFYIRKIYEVYLTDACQYKFSNSARHGIQTRQFTLSIKHL